jgi:RNA polymerase sigma-70 factor (ECF subfamily)
MEYNEATILKLLAQDNAMAFAQLYAQHHDRVFRYAFRFLRSRELALEVVQEVFMRLWRYRQRLSEVNNFEVYLFSIKKNVVYKKLADLAQQHVAEREFASSLSLEDGGTDHPLREEQLQEALRRVVSDLPPQRRQIFQMAKEDHLSYQEIASQLKISPFTVKEQLKLAYRQVRDKLRPFYPSSIILPIVHYLGNLWE